VNRQVLTASGNSSLQSSNLMRESLPNSGGAENKHTVVAPIDGGQGEQGLPTVGGIGTILKRDLSIQLKAYGPMNCIPLE
jgi:hypothetical protein